MKRAIVLAKKGIGYVNPNPVVGAVIVKDDKIIGEGYHEKYGELHAERNALFACKENPVGADMYVTLEPCCHYGKTPPCTEAIIENKIKRVFIGSSDPNPMIKGKGVKILRQAGIIVIENYMKDECDELNQVFFHYIKTKRPYVILKYAMTADGKTATVSGKSKWITGTLARKEVQKIRHKYAGIMVGIETVLSDDPMLNCRLSKGSNPVRIICDSKLRIPMDSQIIKTAKNIKTLVATCQDGGSELIRAGCEIIKTKRKNGHVDLMELMKKLGMRGIDSVLVEGGGQLAYSVLEEGLVNKVNAFVAPKLFGGEGAKTPVRGKGVDSPEDCFFMNKKKISSFEEDILIEYEVINKCLRE